MCLAFPKYFDIFIKLLPEYHWLGTKRYLPIQANIKHVLNVVYIIKYNLESLFLF